MLAALILSYVGQIGPVNFRMEDKSLGIMYQMGLTFFMAVVGLRYGYDVVMSLMGSGLSLAIAAIFVEAAASAGKLPDRSLYFQTELDHLKRCHCRRLYFRARTGSSHQFYRF